MKIEEIAEEAGFLWKTRIAYPWRPTLRHACEEKDSRCRHEELFFVVDPEVRLVDPSEGTTPWECGSPVFICTESGDIHVCGRSCKTVEENEHQREATCRTTGFIVNSHRQPSLEEIAEEAGILWKKDPHTPWRPAPWHACEAKDSGCRHEELFFMADPEVRLIDPADPRTPPEKAAGRASGSPVFVCMQSGNVHVCGRSCKTVEENAPDEREAMCRITGLVVGAHIRHPFWTPYKRLSDGMWKHKFQTNETRRLLGAMEPQKFEGLISCDERSSEAMALSKTNVGDPKARMTAILHMLAAIYFSREKSESDSKKADEEIEKVTRAAESYAQLCKNRRQQVNMTQLQTIRNDFARKGASNLPIRFSKAFQKTLSKAYAKKLMNLWNVLVTYSDFAERLRGGINKAAFVLAAFELMGEGFKSACGIEIIGKDALLAAIPPCEWTKKTIFGKSVGEKVRASATKSMKERMRKALMYVIDVKRISPELVKIDGKTKKSTSFLSLSNVFQKATEIADMPRSSFF